MISRVAENVYWLGRYIERAQAMARLLRTTASHVLDAPGLAPWTAVIIVAGEQRSFHEAHGADAVPDEDTALDWLTWDRRCGVSVASCVHAARENARTTRDVLSREVWETLNQGWLWLNGPEARVQFREDRSGFYARIRDLGHVVLGAASATLPAGDALDLFELGLSLERADQTARALDVHHHALTTEHTGALDDSASTLFWQATLLTCGAREAYFQQRRGSVRGARVAEMLLRDEAFPRSVRCALRSARDRLDRLVPGGTVPSARLTEILVPVETWDAEALLARGIHEELTAVVDGVAEVGAGLYAHLFDPTMRPADPVAPGAPA